MRTPSNERLTSDTADSAAPLEKGPAKPCPQRRCILTGETQERTGMVRLAVSPSGLVLPDVQARAPGRGAWICVDRTALEEALAKGRLKGALARAFKTSELEIPEDLPGKVEDALTRLFLDRLGLEKRTGALISGSHAVSDAARGGKVALLLHAADASEDGRKKLDQAWRVGSDQEGSGKRGAVLPLDRAALSVALGRENVVHLALVRDDAAGRVEGLLQRLLHFTGGAHAAANEGAPAERARPVDDLNT